MRSSLFGLLGLASLVAQTQALYFYLDGSDEKCFFEELPKDTLVVGTYKATQWNEQSRAYVPNADMGVYLTVEEVFSQHHRIVSRQGADSGKFSFSAAEAGDHRLCFRPTNAPSAHGFLFQGSTVGNVKLELDLIIGATSALESADKDKMDKVMQKLKDLNARLQDVRREQVFQREREAEFRDQSESVNARVVRWSIVQIVVLGLTCAWQLTYLRAFFIKQKLT